MLQLFFPGNLAMLDIKIILFWGKTTGIPEEARERKLALGQADMLLAWGMELENATQIIYTADAMLQCGKLCPVGTGENHSCVRFEHCICSVESKTPSEKACQR